MDYLDKDGATVLNDAADMGGVCSIESVGHNITFRNKDKASFTNVTVKLLTIVLKVQVLMSLMRLPILMSPTKATCDASGTLIWQK